MLRRFLQCGLVRGLLALLGDHLIELGRLRLVAKHVDLAASTAGNIATKMRALNPEVLAMVKQSGLADRLGRERMLFNLEVAVERYARMNSTSEVASIDSGGVQN